MNKLFLLLAFVGIGLMACKKKGCMNPLAVNYNAEAKKDDGSCNYSPTIALVGPASVTLNVGDTYIDQGATATNKDGSAAAVTVDESQVNTAEVGTYTVTYSASNEHGTATVTRTVNVVIGQDNWLGAPTCSNTCDVTQFPLAGDPTVSAGATENEIIIDNMFTLVGGQITATIDGQTITVPQQTVNIGVGDIVLSGTGTMNSTGTQFQINYDYDNQTLLIGTTGSCIGVYDY